MNAVQQLIADDIRMTEYRLTFPLEAGLRTALEQKLAALRQQLDAGAGKPDTYRMAA